MKKAFQGGMTRSSASGGVAGIVATRGEHLVTGASAPDRRHLKHGGHVDVSRKRFLKAKQMN